MKISAVVGLSLFRPAAAHGQTTVLAVTSVTAGGSDNARGLAEPRQKHNTSVFGRSSAGLDLGYQGPATTHLLRLAVGGTGYPGSDAGSTFSQEASLVSQFTWPRVLIELGAMGSHSQLDEMQPLLETTVSGIEQPAPVAPAFSDRVGPDEELSPVDTVGYLGGSFAEALSVELTPVWTLYQTGGVDVFSAMQGTQAAPPIWTLSNDLGIERAFPRDAARLELSLGHESTPLTLSQEGVIPAEEGDYGRLAAGWGHQFTPKWRSDLTGGVFAARATSDERLLYGPSWRGSLNWKGKAFRMAGIYDHSAQPSVVMGGIFLTDRGTVRATGRFGHDERFRFTGLIRYARLRALRTIPEPPPVTPPGGLTDPTTEPPGQPAPDQQHDYADRWQAQVSVAWKPWANRLFELALSYRLTTQTGATLGRRRMKTFERNVVLLTMTVAFPTRGEF